MTEHALVDRCSVIDLQLADITTYTRRNKIKWAIRINLGKNLILIVDYRNLSLQIEIYIYFGGRCEGTRICATYPVRVHQKTVLVLSWEYLREVINNTFLLVYVTWFYPISLFPLLYPCRQARLCKCLKPLVNSQRYSGHQNNDNF